MYIFVGCPFCLSFYDLFLLDLGTVPTKWCFLFILLLTCYKSNVETLEAALVEQQLNLTMLRGCEWLFVTCYKRYFSIFIKHRVILGGRFLSVQMHIFLSSMNSSCF